MVVAIILLGFLVIAFSAVLRASASEALWFALAVGVLMWGLATKAPIPFF